MAQQPHAGRGNQQAAGHDRSRRGECRGAAGSDVGHEDRNRERQQRNAGAQRRPMADLLEIEEHEKRSIQSQVQQKPNEGRRGEGRVTEEAQRQHRPCAAMLDRDESAERHDCQRKPAPYDR